MEKGSGGRRIPDFSLRPVARASKGSVGSLISQNQSLTPCVRCKASAHIGGVRHKPQVDAFCCHVLRSLV